MIAEERKRKEFQTAGPTYGEMVQRERPARRQEVSLCAGGSEKPPKDCQNMKLQKDLGVRS